MFLWGLITIHVNQISSHTEVKDFENCLNKDINMYAGAIYVEFLTMTIYLYYYSFTVDFPLIPS